MRSKWHYMNTLPFLSFPFIHTQMTNCSTQTIKVVGNNDIQHSIRGKAYENLSPTSINQSINTSSIYIRLLPTSFIIFSQCSETVYIFTTHHHTSTAYLWSNISISSMNPSVAAWRSGNVVGLDQPDEPMLSPVSTGMGDRVRVRLPEVALFRYVTNHPGRLSLLPSVGR